MAKPRHVKAVTGAPETSATMYRTRESLRKPPAGRLTSIRKKACKDSMIGCAARGAWNRSAPSAHLATARSDVRPLREVRWRCQIVQNGRREKRRKPSNHESGEAYWQNHARRANSWTEAGRD